MVVGAAAAQVFLREADTEAFLPDTVRLVHRLTFAEVHPWAGLFRKTGELATVAGYVAADAQRVGAELALLSAQIGEWNMDCAADAAGQVAFFHVRFERVHPFRDGNGRVGRLLLSEQLCRLIGRANIDWLAVRAQYLAGLSAANKGDLAPLANLMLEALGLPPIKGPYYSRFRIAPRMDSFGASETSLEEDLRWSRIVPSSRAS